MTPGQSGAATSGPGGTSTAAVTSRTGNVKVGILYLNGGNQALSTAFPNSSVSFGNGKAEAQAVVDDVNKHGGINGATIQPVYAQIQATDKDPARQAACQGLVQDNHPLVILSMLNVSEGMVACAQHYHTLLITVAAGAGDDYLNQAARDLSFTPSQISRNLEQTLVLSESRAAGKLGAGAMVGILSQADDPMYDRVATRTIEPLLKSWGVPYMVQSLANATDSSGMSNAVLKFANSHVTQVIFSLGSGGIPETLFMQNADSQQFRPGYLMGDSTDTSFVASAAPKAQAQHIWGVGTYPLVNVAANQYPLQPREKACLAVENASVNAGYTQRGSSLTATMYCELIYGFTSIAKRVTGPLTAAGFAAAYRSTGTAYAPVTTFASNLTPQRNDSASAYRTLAWNDGCSCVTYTSASKPIPGV